MTHPDRKPPRQAPNSSRRLPQVPFVSEPASRIARPTHGYTCKHSTSFRAATWVSPPVRHAPAGPEPVVDHCCARQGSGATIRSQKSARSEAASEKSERLISGRTISVASRRGHAEPVHVASAIGRARFGADVDCCGVAELWVRGRCLLRYNNEAAPLRGPLLLLFARETDSANLALVLLLNIPSISSWPSSFS
jgi:hypothetical protein